MLKEFEIYNLVPCPSVLCIFCWWCLHERLPRLMRVRRRTLLTTRRCGWRMTTRLADNTQTISRVSRLLQARSDRVVALYRKRPSELASRQRNGPASNACHLCTASCPFRCYSNKCARSRRPPARCWSCAASIRVAEPAPAPAGANNPVSPSAACQQRLQQLNFQSNLPVVLVQLQNTDQIAGATAAELQSMV
jgi:hypothetical protein